jgi:prophage regulatory protein
MSGKKMATPTEKADRLMRLPEVLEKKLPVSKSTFWLWIKDGKLPQPHRLSARCSAWWESELDAAIRKLAPKQ